MTYYGKIGTSNIWHIFSSDQITRAQAVALCGTVARKTPTTRHDLPAGAQVCRRCERKGS